MKETETLTSGMVGKMVKLEFTDDWAHMSKTVVFVAGDVTRDVVGVTDTAVIPAEVLERPLQRLYVGVYGVSADGRVSPTIRTEGPWILPGADPSGDEGTAPELPVWAQLQSQIDELKRKMESGDESDENMNGAPIENIKTVLENIMTMLRAQVEDASGTPQGYSMDVSGLAVRNDALIAALGEDETDLPDRTLVGITVSYSGGSVAVGTALSALTGIIVMADYSDGTSESVTDYTLSGSIAVGSNTITVSYQGKTASFAVTGVAESEGTIVEVPMAAGKIGGSGLRIYSDAGETVLRERTGGLWTVYSQEGAYTADTEVTIHWTVTGTLALNNILYAASVEESAVTEAATADTTSIIGYHGEKVVDQAAEGTSGTAVYTVKAGYALMVSNHLGAEYVQVTGVTRAEVE